MAPSRWLRIRVRTASTEARAEAAEALMRLGGSGIEEDEGAIVTYVPEPDDPERFMRRAAEQLRTAVGAEPEVAWSWRSHEDWLELWRRGLEPRRVGRRFVVAPSWTEPNGRPDDIVIEIDPQMAFGTAEHATTRGSLRLLEQAARPGDRVLDVGTGTGILAIGAARLDAGHVLAVDKDEAALVNAHDNVERNGTADTVEVLHGAVDRPFLVVLGPGRFDLILANVLSSVLRPLLPAFRASLDEGGRLVLAGILEEEVEDMSAAAEEAGFRLLAEDIEDGWWSALFERLGRPE